MGSGLSYTPTPIPVAGLQPRVSPRAFDFPSLLVAFKCFPKSRLGPLRIDGDPSSGSCSRRLSRPRRATPPPGPCLRRASLGALLLGPEPPSPPARPPHPASLPQRSPRPLPPVTCPLPPLCDPAPQQGLSQPLPAVACGCGPAPARRAPPRPRLHGPLRSPARGEHPAWGAPPTDVGKLPGAGRCRAGRSLCPHPPHDPDSPSLLAASSQQPPQEGAGRRPESDSHPPPLKKKKKRNDSRPFLASWVRQGTGSLRPRADRSGLWGVPARGQRRGGGGGGGL